jgi:UDP-N-acetylmuramate dehydrogenase
MNRRNVTPLSPQQWDHIQSHFGNRLNRDVALARYTAARIGGPADGLLVVNSVSELLVTATELWKLGISPFILGGGSNMLVSDLGVRGLVILNRAKEIEIDPENNTIWAGSGASFGQLARKSAAQGLQGLEWAAGIPGTVGGAVFGNAGAHGGDVAGNLRMAAILHQDGSQSQWSVSDFGYVYRSSRLKQDQLPVVILSASFNLEASTPKASKTLIEKFTEYRKRTQPPGASLGSMFKNPPNDYAGRLIEAAGLKGTRIGNAEISPVHANFFINHGETKAADIYALTYLARETVLKQYNVNLELEIELLGDFKLTPAT